MPSQRRGAKKRVSLHMPSLRGGCGRVFTVTTTIAITITITIAICLIISMFYQGVIFYAPARPRRASRPSGCAHIREDPTPSKGGRGKAELLLFVGFLCVNALCRNFSRISPEFHQNVTGMSPEYRIGAS